MTRFSSLAAAFTTALALTSPAIAQEPVARADPPADPAAAPAADTAAAPAPDWTKGREIVIQYVRPQDKRGINVFETTKVAGAEYTGFKVDFGAAFASQIQDLSHSNTATPNVANGVDANALMPIGFGFNNSAANLYLHAQLAPGVRVALASYLSSRHHNETWVKDGYLQIDESPIDFVPLKALMQFVTIRAGHFEVNYGDAHFRRSDNGNALYNPFVGNYIMDAFTTEMGGEVYLKSHSIIAMGSITDGELHATVTNPSARGPAYIGKLGFDRQLNKNLRVRLTGSMYHTGKTDSDTLYSGDRAGSRFYFVMENTQATESAQAWSGNINPGFKNRLTALQVNPFVKFKGAEVFGVVERSKGGASAESTDRVFHQYAVDGVYRFLTDEKAFFGARYNWVRGDLATATGVGADRVELGGGYFLTPGLLIKAEYLKQKFSDYPAVSILNGGQFKGFMAEGVVAF